MAGFVTIEQVGPSFEVTTARLIRAMTTANRTVGREVAKVGKKAMLDDVKARRGTLSFGGGRLNVKTRVQSTATEAVVSFRGVSAGAWAIVSTGTRPHQIRVRNRKALHWGGDAYAKFVQHPGTAGRGYWQSAGAALERSLGDVVEDVYDRALAA